VPAAGASPRIAQLPFLPIRAYIPRMTRALDDPSVIESSLRRDPLLLCCASEGGRVTR